MSETQSTKLKNHLTYFYRYQRKKIKYEINVFTSSRVHYWQQRFWRPALYDRFGDRNLWHRINLVDVKAFFLYSSCPLAPLIIRTLIKVLVLTYFLFPLSMMQLCKHFMVANFYHRLEKCKNYRDKFFLEDSEVFWEKRIDFEFEGWVLEKLSWHLKGHSRKRKQGRPAGRLQTLAIIFNYKLS